MNIQNNIEIIHISKGSFKLESINNISTNTLTNEYCKKQYKKKEIICNKCYSFKGLNFRKSMINVLQRNSDLLSNQLLNGITCQEYLIYILDFRAMVN